jgi:hypothetical protein
VTALAITLFQKDSGQKGVEDMRKDIHPEYRKVVFLDTSSDFKFLSGSTQNSEGDW